MTLSPSTLAAISRHQARVVTWRVRVALCIAALVACVALVDMALSTSPMPPEDVSVIQYRLPDYDCSIVQWKRLHGWRNAWAERNGLCASYRAISNTIVVPAYWGDVSLDDMLMPTYVHELTHAAQRKRMGLAGYIAAKTFRRSALVAEAVAEEQRAQRLLGVSVL